MCIKDFLFGIQHDSVPNSWRQGIFQKNVTNSLVLLLLDAVHSHATPKQRSSKHHEETSSIARKHFLTKHAIPPKHLHKRSKTSPNLPKTKHQNAMQTFQIPQKPHSQPKQNKTSTYPTIGFAHNFCLKPNHFLFQPQIAISSSKTPPFSAA